MRGNHIKATLKHDAGAYAQCGNCGRYSDNPDSLKRNDLSCDCGKVNWWSGSFVQPKENSLWNQSSHKQGGNTMKKVPSLTKINVSTFIVLMATLCFTILVYSQDNKSAAIIKQEKFLSDVPFDRAVLYALIAAEQNYAVKMRLLPKIHEDDYYTVILNTAKRLAMADSGRTTLPGIQNAAAPDSSKNKE